MKAMSKKIADRYEQAADLAQDVQLWQDRQRRKAEEELERFFRLSLDMCCVAGFDGYFKRMNQSFERTLGYTIAEMLLHLWLHFIHPDDVEATIATGQEIVAGGNTTRFVNRYRCKDGSYKWLAWVAMPVMEDQIIYATARDVTDLRRSEESLRESELRYRSAVLALEEGILVLDASGTIQACNASAERILGLSADEIVGRTSADPKWQLLWEDGSPVPHDAYPVTITLRTGQPCSNVVMGVHKPDGTLNWILINSQPLVRADGNTVYGVLATFADITELKRTRELLGQKNKELEEARSEIQALRGASR